MTDIPVALEGGMLLNERTQYRRTVEIKIHLAIIEVLKKNPLAPSEVLACLNAISRTEIGHMLKHLPKKPPKGVEDGE